MDLSSDYLAGLLIGTAGTIGLTIGLDVGIASCFGDLFSVSPRGGDFYEYF